jgi:hypothetical protein
MVYASICPQSGNFCSHSTHTPYAPTRMIRKTESTDYHSTHRLSQYTQTITVHTDYHSTPHTDYPSTHRQSQHTQTITIHTDYHSTHRLSQHIQNLYTCCVCTFLFQYQNKRNVNMYPNKRNAAFAFQTVYCLTPYLHSVMLVSQLKNARSSRVTELSENKCLKAALRRWRQGHSRTCLWLTLVLVQDWVDQCSRQSAANGWSCMRWTRESQINVHIIIIHGQAFLLVDELHSIVLVQKLTRTNCLYSPLNFSRRLAQHRNLIKGVLKYTSKRFECDFERQLDPLYGLLTR